MGGVKLGMEPRNNAILATIYRSPKAPTRKLVKRTFRKMPAPYYGPPREKSGEKTLLVSLPIATLSLGHPFGPALSETLSSALLFVSEGNDHMQQSTSYYGTINYGLQLQQWPLPQLINGTVTAPGGSPRELSHRPDRLRSQLLIESRLVYPYPKNTRNSDHGLSFPSPETQTMVWVSPFPNRYRVWGGLSFGPSFSRTMVWVSFREGRNTGVGIDEWALINSGGKKNNNYSTELGPSWTIMVTILLRMETTEMSWRALKHSPDTICLTLFRYTWSKRISAMRPVLVLSGFALMCCVWVLDLRTHNVFFLFDP